MKVAIGIAPIRFIFVFLLIVIMLLLVFEPLFFYVTGLFVFFFLLGWKLEVFINDDHTEISTLFYSYRLRSVSLVTSNLGYKYRYLLGSGEAYYSEPSGYRFLIDKSTQKPIFNSLNHFLFGADRLVQKVNYLYKIFP